MDDKVYKKLTAHFKDDEVKAPPTGKYGKYVPHHLITKRLNDVVPGKWNFTMKKEIRNKEGEIEGVVMSLYIEGLQGPNDEVGDVDRNDKQNGKRTESELLKLAFSDALKRCAMRYGIGLHLWTGLPEEELWSMSSDTTAKQATDSKVVKPTSVKEQPPVVADKKVDPSSSSESSTPLANTKKIIDYVRNTLLFKHGLDADIEERIIKRLVDFGKARMLKGDIGVEEFHDSEIDTLLDKIADYFLKNSESVINTAKDKDLTALSDAGIEATIIEEDKEQEEEMTEIPEGKWMQDPMTDAQKNFIMNTLIPECIDSGQDLIAKEAQRQVESGTLSKGDCSTLITKLKEAKQK